jgi:uncharacterized membrane protein YphA (DoxX/SURF4 family)
MFSRSGIILSANVLRYLLVILFLWAGIGKLIDPKSFARSIDAFGLVPENWLVIVAIGLPILEILIAILVAFRWSWGLPLMGTLLLVFITILWYGVLQGLDVDCGCFSLAEKGAHTSLRQAFWRDILMLSAVIYSFIVDRFLKPDAASATFGPTPQEGEENGA